MKKTILLLIVILPLVMHAQTEKKISTEINEVTVFLEGAQITRNKTLELTQGKIKLTFTGLSPYIDDKSIQLKSTENMIIESVNFSIDHLNKLEKSKEQTQLELQLKEVEKQMELTSTYMKINKEELDFLYENKKINAEGSQSVVQLKSSAEYYSARIKILHLKSLELKEELEKHIEKKNDLLKQIENSAGIENNATGQVIVNADIKKAGSFNLILNYYVKHAGWFPSYDIRVNSVNGPLRLMYKANVFQNTKIDWKTVKLNLSSSMPSQSGTAPKLKTWFLDYYTYPPSYKQGSNEISGIVIDTDNQRLPGAQIMVEGSNISTISGLDGRFSLTLPEDAKNISVSFIGYEKKNIPITGSFIQAVLSPSSIGLEEVVVSGYKSRDKKFLKKSRSEALFFAPEDAAMDFEEEPIKETIETKRSTKQSSFEIEIKEPYSIPSNNQKISVEMEELLLKSAYEYYAAPKVEATAFLMAFLTDWEKLKLLDGEANIFFENTFVGKTLIQGSNASDTLIISLGRDKSVQIKREKIKDYQSIKFLGSKKEETRTWEISLRNNKEEAVNIVLYDQIPVSKNEEIEIILNESAGAILNSETGELKWNLILPETSSKKIRFSYTIKYPKHKKLNLE